MLFGFIFARPAEKREEIKAPVVVKATGDDYWEDQKQWDENPAGGIPFEKLVKETDGG